MLRECFRHEELAKMIMHSDEFYKFFDFVEVSTFDISSDAFSTFKVPINIKIMEKNFVERCQLRTVFNCHVCVCICGNPSMCDCHHVSNND